MSAALANTIDRIRFLGRQAYIHDLRQGDLVLVKHQSDDHSGFLGVFGHIEENFEEQPKKRFRKRPAPKRVLTIGDVRVGADDQFTYFGNAGADVNDLEALLTSLEQRDLLKLTDSYAGRFFTGEVCIFKAPGQAHLLIDKYTEALEATLSNSDYVRVVLLVEPVQDPERDRHLRRH